MGVLNYTPASYSNGTVLTATKLNTEIQTPMTTLQSAWTTFTVSITATTTNPTWGTGSVNEGAYMRIGKTIYGHALATAGTSGFAAGSGNYRLAFPVAPNTSIAQAVCGGGYVYDSSANIMYVCTLRGADATTMQIYYPTAGATFQVGAAAPWVPASGDQFNFFFQYEAA